jgi:hypothetical protein
VVGRLYHSGFYLRKFKTVSLKSGAATSFRSSSTTHDHDNNNDDSIYHVEDIIEISTKYTKPRIAKIISCYQATNIKPYYCNNEDKSLSTIQERGKCTYQSYLMYFVQYISLTFIFCLKKKSILPVVVL